MITNIDSTNYSGLADTLEKYRSKKNINSEYQLNTSWTESTLARLRRGEVMAFCYDDDGICRGFILCQTGRKSVFVSSVFADPGEKQGMILKDLVVSVRENFKRKVLLITNPAPGMSMKSQSDIFTASGFERIDRYQMDLVGEPSLKKSPRPEGVRLRKFDPAYTTKLERLDAVAYKNHPDEVIMGVFRDILGEYPSVRLVNAGKSLFDSRLSNFAFIGDCLAGAIYCARGKNLAGIANIAIDPRYQKMGLGSLLLDRTLRGIKKSPYKGCTLNVSKENTIAYNFYKKIGFKLKRFRPNFVYRLGQGVDTSAKNHFLT